MRAEHSRGLRLAAEATGESESRLERRLNQAAVSVSVDPTLPGAVRVATFLLETLRRGPGHLNLDPTGLQEPAVVSIVSAAGGVAVDATVAVGAAPPNAVLVHVGRVAPAGTICVLADSHGVRLATSGQRLAQRRSPSALGIAYTAAIAATESFKYTAQIGAARCVRHRELAFCPVILSDDLTAAGMLPERTTLHLGVIGTGAIGTAHARILGGLDLAGSYALLADPETFDRENVGTYSLGTIADADTKRRKVDLSSAAMHGWLVDKQHGPVTVAIAKIDAGELPWPALVLCGLDSIEARHEAQGLWPDRLIDAATGDTSVGIHEIVPGGPCMRCLMPAPDASGSAALALAQELGLPVELVMRGDIDLNEAHLAELTVERRARLAPFVGKPICGLASAFGLTGDSAETYRPSVPFVSQQAASLGVGRLIAAVTGVGNMPNVIQYNTLIGPQSMTRLHRRPTPECYCQQRGATIEIVRSSRRARARRA